MRRCVLLLVVLLGSALSCWAWNPPTDTAGPLTVTIEKIDDVRALDVPFPVTVTLENKGDQEVSGSLRLHVIDDWRIERDNPRRFSLAAGAKADLQFSVVAGKKSYAALYPIHAYADFRSGDQALQAHAILITQVAREALAQARPRNLTSVECLAAAAPIKLDGDLSEWGEAVPVALGEAQRSLGSLNAAEFSAVLYALHDDQRLYLGLRVSDQEISAEDLTSDDYMNSDYLRLYCAAQAPALRKGSSLTADDLVVAMNPFAKGGPLVKVPTFGIATRLVDDLTQIACAPKRTATGYEVEIALPLALVGDKLGAGSTLGFNLMIGNALGGRRVGELTLGGMDDAYWLSPNSYVPLHLSSLTHSDAQGALPVTPLSRTATLSLERLSSWRVQVQTPDREPKSLALGWTGSDPETGATFNITTAARPEAKSVIGIHPPFRPGSGTMWADARFTLPAVTPITLTFATAIRDNAATEPPSDGVEWRVYVAPEGGDFAQLFQRFSDAKRWEPATVDLSAYAGKTITLRLWNGTGPKNNSTCDSGFWATPTLTVGERPQAETPAEIAERAQTAITRAKAALRGEKDHFQWLVENSAGKFGVGWAAGPYAFAEGSLAFVAEDGRSVVFERFLMRIDGEDITDPASTRHAVDGRANWTPDGKVTTLRDLIDGPDDSVTTWASISAENGALKIKFSMPTVERSKRGEPRFTLLGVGPTDRAARRVYAGFGNVIQDPGPFTLSAGGFSLSTRHVGVDYDNGISILQASDVFPYRFEVNPDRKLYSLQTGHDATITLIPSLKGAFAAARVYRDVVGFKPAGGVEKLKGKFAIDWWGGHDIAADVRRAGAYGLNDSIFIKHAWQRWGYDYRLPDIYPPSCDPKVWADLVAACKENGILFAPHDNYIDFYPDASDFSYQQILFNADGTPQRAWYNTGRDALSYRWLPGAYQPWLERNLKLIKEGFAPTGYFIDVFTALSPLDYYDQEGNFHTRVECAQKWGECFDYVREQLGDNAPTTSEAGHDALIGHLDGAQADHYSADRWCAKFGDGERVPWHDMASHGSFILLAGGLGSRYSNGDPRSSWGSDDYLSNTVLGGRNPMCGGPCVRDTVMTYWLQHDLCKELAKREMLTHEFVGDDLHRQHVTFSDGGEVWVNRGETPWEVQGVVLPRYGYFAEAGNCVSAIVDKQGLNARYATSPGITFVDTRPVAMDMASRAPVRTEVLSVKDLGGGQVEVVVKWEVLKPLSTGNVVFTHLCHDSVTDQGEKIAFQPSMGLAPEKLQEVGTHLATFRMTFAAAQPDGRYRLRYGIFSPQSGGRLAPIARLDGDRVRGGIFTVTKDDGKVKSVAYEAEGEMPGYARRNTEGTMIDLDAVVTNGSFRLLHSGSQWRLLPLQGSLPFKAELRLDKLGATGKHLVSVTGLAQDGSKVSDEKFVQEDNLIKLDLSAEAFSYELILR
ncbi:hypothetical protein LLH03_14740 [bacterium]|nr:hypothetical protein [bacterium]